MRRLRVLDAFAGAGGAGEGYSRADYDVTSLDILDHPDNPHGPVIVADALEALACRWFLLRAARSLEEGRAAMGIDWMSWSDLTEAIPPAYTEHIGRQLMAHLRAEVAA